jgi:hypothetical protein
LALSIGRSISDKRKATIESSHSMIGTAFAALTSGEQKTAMKHHNPNVCGMFLAEFVQICPVAIDKFQFSRQ